MTAPAENESALDAAHTRQATYRLFERWSRGLQIETAAEGPLDGVAGAPGLHLLEFARQGVRVKVFLPDDEPLAHVRAVYRTHALERMLTTGRLAADTVPAGPVDVLVSYDAVGLVPDWRAYLARLFRAEARWLFVVAANPESMAWGARPAIARAELEEELGRAGRILSHDYFDCPWWPARTARLLDRAPAALPRRFGRRHGYLVAKR